MKIYQQEDRKAESKGVFLSAYQPPPALRGCLCRTLRCFKRTGSNTHSEVLVNRKQVVLREKNKQVLASSFDGFGGVSMPLRADSKLLFWPQCWIKVFMACSGCCQGPTPWSQVCECFRLLQRRVGLDCKRCYILDKTVFCSTCDQVFWEGVPDSHS